MGGYSFRFLKVTSIRRWLTILGPLVLAGTTAWASPAWTSGLAAEKTPFMKVGVGTSVITPPLDMPLEGYFYPRMAEGVHDPLLAKSLVLDDGRQTIVLVACDLVGISGPIVREARRIIDAQLGIPGDRVLISATHSHTGPQLNDEYGHRLSRWIADAVRKAFGNRRPARLYVATEPEASLPFNRRYLMKDGTVRTNPGFLNPEVVRPVAPIDPRVGVIYADDAERRPIVTWVNYAMHLDTVGGTSISADYPYFLGARLGGVKGQEMLTMFMIGAAGDVNHWDVRRPGPQRGLEVAQRLGEVLAGDVIKAYAHLEPVARPGVRAARAVMELPAQAHTPEELAEARQVLATPPDRDVDFTLDRVKATRIAELEERGGKPLSAEIQVLAAGPIAWVGVPGEPFVELGLDIQKRSPFRYTFIVGLANDNFDYLPTRGAYLQGGYEPTSARVATGSGEAIVSKALELLRKLAAQDR